MQRKGLSITKNNNKLHEYNRMVGLNVIQINIMQRIGLSNNNKLHKYNRMVGLNITKNNNKLHEYNI